MTLLCHCQVSACGKQKHIRYRQHAHALRMGWNSSCTYLWKAGAVIQVLSRIWALWGVVNLAPEATSTGAVTFFRAGPVVLQTSLVTLLFCWCVTEVLRYAFYAAKVCSHSAAPDEPPARCPLHAASGNLQQWCSQIFQQV